MKTFVVGRYYFNSLFRDESNKNFIEELQKEPYMEANNYTYALGNFSGDDYNGHDLLRGTFGRVRKGETAEVYDKENKEFKVKAMPDVADVMLEFLINHSNHLIFVESDSRIKPDYFANIFKKIYTKTSSIADIEIDFILIEKDIFDSLKKWDKVNKVIFKKLRPSNPSSYDDFKEIEDLIKETGSASTNMEFVATEIKNGQNNEKGLVYDSKLIKQGISLSAHGYGKASIDGDEGNEKVHVESGQFLKRVVVDFSEEGALSRITQTIEEISKNEQ